MPKLRVISSQLKKPKLRGRSQLTGRIGFSRETGTELAMREGQHVLLMVDDDNPSPTHIFIQSTEDSSIDSFELKKASDYFYLNARSFFEALDFDYTQKIIKYRIKITPIDGIDVLECIGVEADHIKKTDEII